MKKQLMRMLFAVTVLLAPSVWSDTYWAAPDGTEDAACTEEAPGTIAAALAKCVARDTVEEGDVVRLKDGEYPFTEALTVETPNVVIEAQNRHQAVLIGGRVSTNSFLAFNVSKNAKFDGLVFTNFYINMREVYGAITILSGTAFVDNCRFIDNREPDGYDRPWNSGSAIGVRYNGGRAVVSNCYFKSNACKGHWDDASGGGGAVSFYRGQDSVVTDSVFEDNTCHGNGNQGGAGLWGSYYRCTFRGNFAYNGMVLRYGSAYDCLFEDNKGDGPVVYNGSVSNCVIRGSNGNVLFWSTTLTDCVVTNNINTINTVWDSYFFRDCTVKNSLIKDNAFTAVNDVKWFAWNSHFSNCLIVSNGLLRSTFAFNSGSTKGDSCSLANCTLIDNYYWRYKTPIEMNLVDNYQETVTDEEGNSTTEARVALGGCTNTVIIGSTLVSGRYVNSAYIDATEGENLAFENSLCLPDRDAFKLRQETSASGHIYAPKSGSPLVDAGLDFDGLPRLDLLGKPRRSGASVDIGAMEYCLAGFWLMLR
ncbi:MAG: choice-of-anchor Q domain-containing protein [Kiritimatiellia bacterium]